MTEESGLKIELIPACVRITTPDGEEMLVEAGSAIRVGEMLIERGDEGVMVEGATMEISVNGWKAQVEIADALNLGRLMVEYGENAKMVNEHL